MLFIHIRIHLRGDVRGILIFKWKLLEIFNIFTKYTTTIFPKQLKILNNTFPHSKKKKFYGNFLISYAIIVRVLSLHFSILVRKGSVNAA